MIKYNRIRLTVSVKDDKKGKYFTVGAHKFYLSEFTFDNEYEVGFFIGADNPTDYPFILSEYGKNSSFPHELDISI